MDIDLVDDAHILDPELLQLPGLSISSLKPSPQIIEELFSQWLSFPETGRLVKSLIDEVNSGAPSNVSKTNTSNSIVGASAMPAVFLSNGAPPLSPRSSTGSPRFSRQRSSPPSLKSPLLSVKEQKRELIPQFYFQHGCPLAKEQKEQCISMVDQYFSNYIDGLHVNEFKSVTKEVCKLPSFLSPALFGKIDSNSTGIVTRDAFIKYWIDGNIITMDTASQIFNILRQESCKYLRQADFKPVLDELLETHPGLEFLKTSYEFQEKYAETVIYRIFYYINRSGTGCLTLRELKRGNLIPAMQQLDEDDDINNVIRYFSYEHFYVIYCKFWELDGDHDCFIETENLIKYGNHGLTYRIVDRIFSQVPRKFTSEVEGKMGFEDFVYFILAEEDKLSEPSLEYWFKCLDLDGNGVITRDEMQFFFDEQLQRMECITQEPVQFSDILCQIIDMIRPEKENCITLRDLKNSKLSGNVFNILFNLNKFMAFELRDPSLIAQNGEDPTLTEWDRFVQREYARLIKEEDLDEVSNGSAEVWDEPLEPSS